MYYCRVREGSYARFWRLKTFFQTQYYVGNDMQNLAYERSHRVLTFYIFFLSHGSSLGEWWPHLFGFWFAGVVSVALVLLALRALPCVALRCPAFVLCVPVGMS